MQVPFLTQSSLILSDATGSVLLVRFGKDPWRLPSEEISGVYGDVRCQLASSVNRQLGFPDQVKATDLQFIGLLQCLREIRLLLIFGSQYVGPMTLTEHTRYDEIQAFPLGALPDNLLPLHRKALETSIAKLGFDVVSL